MRNEAAVKGRRALVTGAAVGIGRATVEKLSAAGWDVVFTYRTSHEAAQDLVSRLGVVARRVDLSSREETLQFAEQIRDEFEFGALVNNAGAFALQPVGRLGLETWDRTFEVNVTAPLILTQMLSERMASGSSVVNVSSIDHRGSFSSYAYSASKAALLSVTQSLANLYGESGIRVNAVLPGWVDTGMSTPEALTAGEVAPLKRNATANEVATVVEFLLGENSSFITGASITVDGGYSGVDPIMRQEYENLRASWSIRTPRE